MLAAPVCEWDEFLPVSVQPSSTKQTMLGYPAHAIDETSPCGQLRNVKKECELGKITIFVLAQQPFQRDLSPHAASGNAKSPDRKRNPKVLQPRAL